MIKNIVKETISNLNKNKFNNNLIRKINWNKKIIIKNKILSLAHNKNLTLPEIREIIVEQEQLCSRASFYRYLNRLKKRKLIDVVKIDDIEVVVRV